MVEKPASIHYFDVSMDKEMERTPNESLLYSARHGDSTNISQLFKNHLEDKTDLNINCKGTSKANLGWTPLHLSSYFGHAETVSLLLQRGADVNVINDVGDTPLHRAAYTGRVEAVLLLLHYNTDVNLKNSEGFTAKQISKTDDIRDLIGATEVFEEKKCEENLLRASRDGEADVIQTLLKCNNPPNINCHDSYGNTALHNAAKRGKKEVLILLLQNGCDTSRKNQNNQTAYDLARDGQTAQLLDVRPIKHLQREVQRFEGPLTKKSRFMGWRSLWVVLDKGVLSLFRNRADATTGTRRVGFKYLDNSRVECQRDVGHILKIYFADDTFYTCAVGMDLNSTVNRQKWETALAEHIAYATQFVMLGWQDISEDEDEPESVPLGSMQDNLREAEAQRVVLEKQTQRLATAVNGLGNDKASSKQVSLLSIRQQLNCILDSSHEMCSSLQHCLTVFTQEDQNRKLQLNQESEKVRVLQASLRVLAQEHLDLEQSLGGGHRSPSMAESENEEFFDCDNDNSEDSEIDFTASGSNGVTQPEVNMEGLSMANTPGTSNGVVRQKASTSTKLSKWGYRTNLPVPMFSRNNFSVWTFLKQCIGKELSKITMPVIFNEPISFLQRMTEYMEYSSQLNKAATCTDPIRRFEYVIAFAVSSASSNWDRLGKPFNPLLGETYQLDRTADLGFKYVSEQVCHHPPVSAFHVMAPQYAFHGSVHPKLKFWGKSVEVTPKGLVTLYLKEFDETYTWQNVNCCIHNIIVGKLWIEHYGTMEIVNQKTKDKCVLNFKPSGWFGKDLHKVEGFLYNANKKKVRAIYGKWIEALYSYDIDIWEKYQSSHKLPSQSQLNKGQTSESDDDPMPVRGSTCNLTLKDQRILWIADLRPSDSEKYYNFTHFTLMLNELKDDVKATLPPTDSRLRPDMRSLEEGDLDSAAAEKHRVEEKQRASRKDRKKNTSEWQPKWFKSETNQFTGKDDWVFQEDYWSKNWQSCPDIF